MVHRSLEQGEAGAGQQLSAPAILVFARMDSTRLPGKVLADLEGRPLLGRVLDRLRRSSQCSRIVVATSDRTLDDPILNFVETEGAELFRGDSTDVAGRAISCCEALGIESFVRISGDSPFIPPELIDRAVEVAGSDEADLVTNVHPRTWPPGASVEIIQLNSLHRAHPRMSAQEREDVTVYFYNGPEGWRISNLSAPDDRYKGVRLTVDTADELERARTLISLMGSEPEMVSLDRIVELSRALEDAV